MVLLAVGIKGYFLFRNDENEGFLLDYLPGLGLCLLFQVTFPIQQMPLGQESKD